MNYDELARMAESMPRIPKRELKCHPSVAAALRGLEYDNETVTLFGFAALGTGLLGIPVFEDDTLPWGAWKIYEDDEVAAAGVIVRDVQ